MLLCFAASGATVPCDVLLLSGQVIVDESMLTGEAIPQCKEGLDAADDGDLVSSPTARIHVLFGGTRIVQATPAECGAALRTPDKGVLAYVLKTGFATSQGALVRTVAAASAPIAVDSRDIIVYIGLLLIFAVSAAVYIWKAGIAAGRAPERLVMHSSLNPNTNPILALTTTPSVFPAPAPVPATNSSPNPNLSKPAARWSNVCWLLRLWSLPSYRCNYLWLLPKSITLTLTLTLTLN